MKNYYGQQFFTRAQCSYSMALLRYLNPKDGLPDPKGSLSQSVPSRAIAAANEEVTRARSGVKKRGPYRRYTPEERMEIGRYASNHGITAAARYFTRRFQQSVRESTVQPEEESEDTNEDIL